MAGLCEIGAGTVGVVERFPERHEGWSSGPDTNVVVASVVASGALAIPVASSTRALSDEC